LRSPSQDQARIQGDLTLSRPMKKKQFLALMLFAATGASQLCLTAKACDNLIDRINRKSQQIDSLVSVAGNAWKQGNRGLYCQKTRQAKAAQEQTLELVNAYAECVGFLTNSNVQTMQRSQANLSVLNNALRNC
jgi:hypothetical protein